MTQTPTHRWGPWRFVAWFGIVSLLVDIVYQGARSMAGPYLVTLGASALVIGLVTGLGEATAMIGRLASGPLADRDGSAWPLAILGYLLTIVTVPIMGLTSSLIIVSSLIVIERAGKAVRAPARDVMLAHATATVGRGKGFGLHQALDQFGSIAGPLLAAGVLVLTGLYGWAFAVLALPGGVALFALMWLRRRVPTPQDFDPEMAPADDGEERPRHRARDLGAPYWWYLGFSMVASAGYGTFAVLTYRLAADHLVAMATIPLIYAAAMAAGAVSSLAIGWWFDRFGRAVLIAVPPLTAAIPPLVFGFGVWTAVAGLLLWGLAQGIQGSVMRAAVASLAPARLRGTAYGLFAVGSGLSLLIGGVLIGWLYDVSVPLLCIVVALIEVAALFVFLVSQRIAASAAVPIG